MLLCVRDHATQYDPPFWLAIARVSRDPLRVWYTAAAAPRDGQGQRAAEWGASRKEYEQHYVPVQRVARALVALDARLSAIVVPNWRHPVTPQLAAIARARRIPVIVSIDKTLNEPSPSGITGHAYTAVQAIQSRFFDGYFTTGLLGRQYLASLGVPHERIAEGLYPVDVAHFQHRVHELGSKIAEIRHAMVHASNVVLAVSELYAREHLLLLEGFAQVRRTLPNARLVLVCGGPMLAAFEQRVRELDLTRNVLLTGQVPYPELAAWYAAADVFVHVHEEEPWGRNLLDAMACGVPVVASTTAASATDVVIHGRTGAVAYPNDATSIATAIQLVLTSVRKGDPRVGAAIASAIDRFDVSQVARKLLDLCDRLQGPLPQSRPLPSVVISDLRNVFGRWSR